MNEILGLLKDGKWHDLNEIMEEFRLTRSGAETVTNFLAEYNFIQLDKERQRARLTPSALSFLKKIQQIEEESEWSSLCGQKGFKVAVGSKEGAALSCRFEKVWVSLASFFRHGQEPPIQKKIQISLKLPKAEIRFIHNVGFLGALIRLTQNVRNNIHSASVRKLRLILNPKQAGHQTCIFVLQ